MDLYNFFVHCRHESCVRYATPMFPSWLWFCYFTFSVMSSDVTSRLVVSFTFLGLFTWPLFLPVALWLLLTHAKKNLTSVPLWSLSPPSRLLIPPQNPGIWMVHSLAVSGSPFKCYLLRELSLTTASRTAFPRPLTPSYFSS